MWIACEVRETPETGTARVRRTVEIPIRHGRATVTSFEGLSDGREHIALLFGDWKNESNPLVRLHSECLTGDVFGSGKCDCGEQLDEAVRKMSESSGILLYLRQEGRGIGL